MPANDQNNPAQSFTWVPLYRELADRIAEWESRQGELIAFLEKLRADGFVVTPLSDKDEQDSRFLLTEIDPFTFFGVFNRGIRQEQRMGILGEMKKQFGCAAEIPTDFAGIPILNNQRSWFVAYQHLRKRDDIRKLWNVFRLALSDEPLINPRFHSAYDDALQVRGVNVNLSMGLFWIRPDTFLSFDGTNRSYLKLDAKTALSADSYCTTLQQIVAEHNKPIVQLSYEAYTSTKKEGGGNKSGGGESDISTKASYWFVGAYWSSRGPSERTQQFLDEGIWKNGYKDKYLDDVRAMKVGERIAIKATSTQKNNLPFDSKGNTASRMTIKAIGTIVANRGDGRTVEVEWESDFEPRDWYFFTYQATVWRLTLQQDYANKEYARKLIEFAFYDKPQDYDWFCERWYGDDVEDEDEGDDGPQPRPYSVEDMVASGIFLKEDELRQVLARLNSKKNLIIQGPPGVGKTFIARKLAYALMEERDATRVEFVQFHQSYSYEDFVRGYRPLESEGGTFGLQDGVFFEFCQRAKDDPDRPFVFIIDEINRGNLSQIFGELLMLIEADKRGADHGVPLLYRKQDEPRFFVPSNVYLIGLMNLADRSLALVDYALRRRFAFMSLAPQYESDLFRLWLVERSMDSELVDLIVARLGALNKEISEDALLGENYQVGHSFFCPKGSDFAGLNRDWYARIIETEIVPLLKEYWFDNVKRSSEVRKRLLAP